MLLLRAKQGLTLNSFYAEKRLHMYFTCAALCFFDRPIKLLYQEYSRFSDKSEIVNSGVSPHLIPLFYEADISSLHVVFLVWSGRLTASRSILCLKRMSHRFSAPLGRSGVSPLQGRLYCLKRTSHRFGQSVLFGADISSLPTSPFLTARVRLCHAVLPGR